MTAVAALPGTRFGLAIGDATAMAVRDVRRMLRAPDQVVFTLISPIMFTLLFRYVFGGAIRGLGDINYVNYLIPGIAVQTAIFTSGNTGFALAEDRSKGFVDRLRSLPMARSAVLVGQVAAVALSNLVGLFIIVIVGLVVGFRPHSVPGAHLRIRHTAGFQRGHVVALRPGRPVCQQFPGRQRRHLPAHLPADVRQQRLRAHLDDADLAAGVRQPQSGDHRHQRRPGPHPWNRHARTASGVVQREEHHVPGGRLAYLDGGDRRGVRLPGCAPLQLDYLVVENPAVGGAVTVARHPRASPATCSRASRCCSREPNPAPMVLTLTWLTPASRHAASCSATSDAPWPHGTRVSIPMLAGSRPAERVHNPQQHHL